MSTGRFAPSPTGRLHLGNLRTAIAAWLWSRREGGGFIVRMEDLDRVTSRREHEEVQLADLAAIGLDWDGVVVRQSERFDRYDAVVDELTASGRTFECFCTRREIAEAVNAPNGPARGGLYPGTCRELHPARREARRAEGRPAAIRLRSDHRVVEFVDEVAGTRSGVVDDVVLRRNDGVPAYNLAVVVDDVAQGVDLVVRGDDLLDSVPAQVELREFVGGAPLRWAHVPLVLSERGRRLAKRDGAVTLPDRLDLGDTAADVVRFLLSSLGVTPDPDAGTPAELMDAARRTFRPADVPPEPLVLTDAMLARPLREHPGPEES